jgi:hypothetical protein
MDTGPVGVGIDVAKEQLDVALGAEGSTWSMPNDEAGIRALLVELRKHTCALVVLEATGGFELPAVSALAAAGLPVAAVNPRQVRNFARTIGQLAKTDRLNARVLATFTERVRPEVRALPDGGRALAGCPAHPALSDHRNDRGREQPARVRTGAAEEEHRQAHTLAAPKTRGRRCRSQPADPGESCVAREGGALSRSARRGAGRLAHAHRRPTRARPAQPQGDRGARRRRASGPR